MDELQKIREALGWTAGTPEAIAREIYRLRESAGELERDLLNIEMVKLEEVNRVQVPRDARIVGLLLRTKAQVVRGAARSAGVPLRRSRTRCPRE